MNTNAVIAAGLALNSVGSAGYIRDVMRGVTQPNRASFTMWAVAPLLAVVAELRAGVGMQALITFASGMWPAMIVVASFTNPRAYWRLTRFDYTCAAVSLLALVLWYLNGSGDLAIVLLILADVMACIPTIRKAWRHPHSETGWSYLTACAGACTGIIAAPSFTIAALAFPVYLVSATLTLAVLVMVPRVAHRQPAAVPSNTAA